MGVGDLELPMMQIIQNIRQTIGHQIPFAAILLVIKATDYRASTQEVIAAKAISKFFSNLDHSRVFAVFTHCDLLRPDEEFMMKKLQSIQSYSGLTI